MRLACAAMALATVLALTMPEAAAGDAPIKIGTALDFSVLYTRAVPEYSQGQRDFVSLINGRGGIKGHRLELIIVDHGSDVQRGIDAYQRFKREGAVLVDFLSTPVSRAVVPMALADGMNIMTLFHGRGDAADGRVFPTIFPMVATYWSQAADIVKYIGDEEQELIKGKRIALVAIDNGVGHEPEPVFQELSKRLGFRFSAFYYPPPGTDQAATWKAARRFRPDWTIIWAAGDAQTQSVREALAQGVKLDHVVANVNIQDSDLTLAGATKAAGLLRFEGVASGRTPPLIAAIEQEVIAPGRGAGPPDNVGQTYYNGGVASMALVAEGARLGLESGGEPLTAAKPPHAFSRARSAGRRRFRVCCRV